MKNYSKTKYVFSFRDKFDNEQETKTYNCWNKRDAMQIAHDLLANLCDSEIVKIKTQKSN